MRPRRDGGRAHGPLAAYAIVAGLAVLALASGCSSRTPPITAPLLDVSGAVERQGAPAAALHIELRTPGGRLMASAHTTSMGTYAIQLDAPGSWEIKAVGSRPDDFDSVIFDFLLQADHPLVLRTLDIHGYGAAAVSPADSASAPAPNPIQPLVFQWLMPARTGALARVQCFDSTGTGVWYSNWLDTTQVAWNGLLNQGAVAGQLAPPGEYTWRMKFSLPDSSNGHTPYRTLKLN